MKPVRLHSLARAEIREAIAYYNSARDGLGDDFRDEVETALDRTPETNGDSNGQPTA